MPVTSQARNKSSGPSKLKDAKSISSSKKVILKFPVSCAAQYLNAGKHVEYISANVSIYFIGVLEYFVVEVSTPFLTNFMVGHISTYIGFCLEILLHKYFTTHMAILMLTNLICFMYLEEQKYCNEIWLALKMPYVW